MKSLERQLQINLAIILVLVMALIWGVGLVLPWFFAETQTLHSPAAVSVLPERVRYRQASPATFQMAVSDSGGWRHYADSGYSRRGHPPHVSSP